MANTGSNIAIDTGDAGGDYFASQHKFVTLKEIKSKTRKNSRLDQKKPDNRALLYVELCLN